MSPKIGLRSLVILAAGSIFGAAVAVGAMALIPSANAPRTPAIPADISPESLHLLADVFARVHSDYVDKIDDQRLVDSAIRGVLEGLDSHSRYLDPAHYADLRIDTTGSYTGIGLELSLDDGRLVVVSSTAGTPAARAGFRPGDVIVAVNQVPVSAYHMGAAVARMRGAPGTSVSLTVERLGRHAPLRFHLTREAIRIRTVQDAYLGRGYAYIRVTGFSDSTSRELTGAASRLIEQAGGRLNGLVLDLRDNPGGVLRSAVAVADEFLGKGLIVRGEGRIPQADFVWYASSGGLLEKVPLAVLVDKGSASAAEIVAAAIQDHHRGRLLGVRTYGKGSVQTVMPLEDGAAIKLTTALYLTPSGRSINGTGLAPDVVVHASDTDRQARFATNGLDRRGDTQLSAALRLLGYNPDATRPTLLQVRADP